MPSIASSANWVYQGTNQSTLPIPVPSGVVNGSKIVAHTCYVWHTTNVGFSVPTINPPAGFTLFGVKTFIDDEDTYYVRHTWWWKDATGSDTGTYSFVGGVIIQNGVTYSAIAVGGYAFRVLGSAPAGISPFIDIGHYSNTSVGKTSFQISSFTPSQNDVLLLFGGESIGGSSTLTSLPDDWTRGEQASGHSGGTPIGKIAYAYKNMPMADDTGSMTFDMKSGGNQWGGIVTIAPPQAIVEVPLITASGSAGNPTISTSGNANVVASVMTGTGDLTNPVTFFFAEVLPGSGLFRAPKVATGATAAVATGTGVMGGPTPLGVMNATVPVTRTVWTGLLIPPERVEARIEAPAALASGSGLLRTTGISVLGMKNPTVPVDLLSDELGEFFDPDVTAGATVFAEVATASGELPTPEIPHDGHVTLVLMSGSNALTHPTIIGGVSVRVFAPNLTGTNAAATHPTVMGQMNPTIPVTRPLGSGHLNIPALLAGHGVNVSATVAAANSTTKTPVVHAVRNPLVSATRATGSGLLHFGVALHGTAVVSSTRALAYVALRAPTVIGQQISLITVVGAMTGTAPTRAPVARGDAVVRAPRMLSAGTMGTPVVASSDNHYGPKVMIAGVETPANWTIMVGGVEVPVDLTIMHNGAETQLE